MSLLINYRLYMQLRLHSVNDNGVPTSRNLIGSLTSSCLNRFSSVGILTYRSTAATYRVAYLNVVGSVVGFVANFILFPAVTEFPRAVTF